MATPPLVRLDTSDPRPIWKQIEDGIRAAIALGTLPPGAPVPSVRDLARTLRVNPNTVARAIQRLADDGQVETRRGEGTFVAAAPPATTRRDRADGLAEAAGRFAAAAATLGADADEALAAARTALERLHGRRKDGSS